MQNKIIKLPDEDRRWRNQPFCPSCYYWLFGQDVGSIYCPHCGIKLSWDSEKANKYHEMSYDISIERYNQLKKAIKNAK